MDFSPWELVAPVERVEKDGGATALVRTTFALRCLSSPCVPPRDTAPLDFDPVVVEYGDNGRLDVPWPRLVVHSRIPDRGGRRSRPPAAPSAAGRSSRGRPTCSRCRPCPTASRRGSSSRFCSRSASCSSWPAARSSTAPGRSARRRSSRWWNSRPSPRCLRWCWRSPSSSSRRPRTGPPTAGGRSSSWRTRSKGRTRGSRAPRGGSPGRRTRRRWRPRAGSRRRPGRCSSPTGSRS